MAKVQAMKKEAEMAGYQDFSVEALPGVQAAVSGALQQVYDSIKSDAAEVKRDIIITVSFTPQPDAIKVVPKVKVNLPKPDVITLPSSWGIKENGTIRIEVPKQPSMFDTE